MDREQLITAMRQTAAQKPRPVVVEGWGTVYLRELTVAEVEEQTRDAESKEDKNRLARSAARLLCDEDGKRLFDPDSAEDVALLATQPWALLRRVLAEADDVKEAAAGN